MLKEGRVDWATAEAMAVGSLLREGYNVRLSGQDVQRGTFSQRHFVFHDQQSGATACPLNSWTAATGRLDVHNSHLSEFAVVGFEYGVSIADAKGTLPIWEAQFGDFFNGAQVIFDAFVSSGEAKWGLQSGLVVLLPHGYDGTGPEHSSCRLERFLQMSSAPLDPHDQSRSPNWHVAHPTTPANYFHLLRRQMQQGFRKPLIVASPKTLLRLPAAQSSLEEFVGSTSFQPVVQDPRQPAASSIRRLVLCSGKFYYELERERASRKDDKTAIVRIEELCPLPAPQIGAILARYRRLKEVVWCQEEHRNMGAYTYVAPRLQALLPRALQLKYVGRTEAAAPAAGYSKLHRQELAAIFTDLFG